MAGKGNKKGRRKNGRPNDSGKQGRKGKSGQNGTENLQP